MKRPQPLLVLPVGDALQEPFWPEGLGVNRGMHNALDACWEYFVEVTRRFARQHLGANFSGLPDGFGPFRRPAENGKFFHGEPSGDGEDANRFRVARKPYGAGMVPKGRYLYGEGNPWALTATEAETFCGNALSAHLARKASGKTHLTRSWRAFDAVTRLFAR